MSRIVIISNRLPITIEKQDDKLIYHPSAGGLATGLNSLDESLPRIWIGWPGQVIKDKAGRENVRKDLDDRDLAPVFLSGKEISLYYEGFANKTIWPHFHYFTQYTTYSDEYWEAYKSVNQKFADVVNGIIRENDLVWVHDYQLMLLPRMIRDKHPNVSIGFFLHIPFPSYEVFRILPWRKQILEGVLGSDQIGFHTFGYMRHFLSAVYRIVGHEHNFGKLTIGKRLVNVDVYPMGIDYEKYAHPEEHAEGSEESLKIKKLAESTRLIASIDRLDYSKGIEQRLYAFRRFLERYPAYSGKVTLAMVVVPSRSGVDQYQELKHHVDELVGEINGEFGSFDWEPVKYFYRSLDFGDLTTLYKVADIALITPLRDGMNLVAKEYVASKEESKKGVVILSEMAGAANELTEAIIVNPQDINDLVDALKRALEMDESEQAWRLETMQKKIRKYDIRNWANAFMKEQRALMEEQREQNTYRLDEKEREELHQAFKNAESRLIVLDYDGTLMPFNPDPKAVVPDQDLLNVLGKLAKKGNTKVVVNSGRDRDTLQKWLGPLGVDMAAEHGVWTKRNGEWTSNPNLEKGWMPRIRTVLENLVERTPGSFIEEKDFSIAWHYRRVDKDFGEKRVREFRDVLRYLTANLDLQVLEGKKVVEIKNAGVNKGKATLSWLNERDWDFVLAIGDDHSDEDTFKVVSPEAYTIKVGIQKSSARYNLLSIEHVRRLLEEFVELK
jgi:trehalose 6-phosphate synthase/phosphatase